LNAALRVAMLKLRRSASLSSAVSHIMAGGWTPGYRCGASLGRQYTVQANF
jgi:hypothetical protein